MTTDIKSILIRCEKLNQEVGVLIKQWRIKLIQSLILLGLGMTLLIASFTLNQSLMLLAISLILVSSFWADIGRCRDKINNRIGRIDELLRLLEGK